MTHARHETTREMQARLGGSAIFWFDAFEGRQPFDFLSNFYAGEPIAESGADNAWATGEHMFAAYKARNPLDFQRIHDSISPGEAKSIGRRITLRGDWEAVKYDVMRWVLACKFTLDREEGRRLLETGDALLVEGTWWGDEVWGVDLSSAPSDAPWRSRGRNWLGALLMARRAELRAEQGFGVAPNYAVLRDFARRGRMR